VGSSRRVDCAPSKGRRCTMDFAGTAQDNRGRTTMQRRKLLVGIGSLAAGGAATMGTGAFGVLANDRDAEGTIVNDNDAYLQLIPRGEYSNIGGGDGDAELNVTLQRLNSDSTTELDDVFYIRNPSQGQDDVTVQITDISNFPSDVNIDDVFISSKSGGVPASVGATLLNTDRSLPVGEEIGVGTTVTVTGKLPDGASQSGTFDVDAL